MRRYEALKVLGERLRDEVCIISLGGVVDEWYNARPEPRGASMYLQALGCHVPLAFGVALGLPHRKVLCLETDGSLLLHLGILATLGNQRPENLAIFVFDNECYESIGGPPTHTAGVVDLAAIARGAGVEDAETVRTREELEQRVKKALTQRGLHFTVVKIERGVEPGLPRKKSDGIEDKYLFVRYLEEKEGITIIPPSQHN